MMYNVDITNVNGTLNVHRNNTHTMFPSQSNLWTDRFEKSKNGKMKRKMMEDTEKETDKYAKKMVT